MFQAIDHGKKHELSQLLIHFPDFIDLKNM